MHLHDIILGLMLDRILQAMLDIFLNQQPLGLFDVKFQELQLFHNIQPLGLY
jgi:hypothetical protein